MKRTDYIETREDIISNIETLYSYLHGDSGKESMLWAVDRLKRGKNMVVEVINNHIFFAPSRFVGYINNTKDKHEENHGNGTDTDNVLKEYYNKIQDGRLDAVLQCELLKYNESSAEKRYWIYKDTNVEEVLKYAQMHTPNLPLEIDYNKFWHIQMHLPEGKGGVVIDSSLMLKEAEPIIGTGEWDDAQCRNFKTIPNGNIVLVRRGSQVLALCQIIGENFINDTLSEKYVNVNFRKVRILAWASEYKQPRTGLFSQGTFSSCRKGTEQYGYIASWLKYMNDIAYLDKCANLLRKKHNMILQGAPGTGKTYNTAAIALKALGINDVDMTDHKAIMKRYDSLLDDQIFFTTFHQSLDYEDFVEGLKPHVQTDADGNSIGVTYEPEDGIFKRACNAVQTDQSKDIVECIDDYLQKIKGYQNKREIPTVTGRSSLYVWWKEGNSTVSSRSTNSASSRGEEYIPSPLNIEKIKLQALGKGCENNWQSYAQAFIEAVKKEYHATTDKPVVLIIDEINRGNVSKIFGELITLLESDKRSNGNHPIKVILPYTKGEFGIPSNLYIIGTMNTTDRSTGTLDYALRRRFAFVTLKSQDSVIKKYYSDSRNEDLGSVAVALFADIKKFIENPKHLCGDMSIDDLMVGHSYFMAESEAELQDKVEFEILPLINEYINDGILNVKNEEKKTVFDAWSSLNPIQVTEEDDQEDDDE
ncbi:McrB family protein [Prevotella histicola]|uniref:McrB family protein n=1 Tax=Prevotella histicola TaxID=470565 RepID=UPI002151130E|nr:AAA family ATPase [Prevotella histicola]